MDNHFQFQKTPDDEKNLCHERKLMSSDLNGLFVESSPSTRGGVMQARKYGTTKVDKKRAVRTSLS